MPIGVYLAGAMRFDAGEVEAHDRGWRRAVENRLEDLSGSVQVYNPMRGEMAAALFNKFEIEPNALLHQDMACILRSDVILMNLLTLTGGYPHIGTLAELGISIAHHKLLIVLADTPTVARHPFVQAGATRVLPNLEQGIEYLRGVIGVLLGETV